MSDGGLPGAAAGAAVVNAATGGSAPDTGAPAAFSRGVLGRLLRHRSGSLGLVLTVAFAALAVVGPWVAPYDPAIPDYTHLAKGASGARTRRCRASGRDTFSRILAGARYSITIGLAATVIGALVGGA
ncbi:MAG TPA: hypothetical protein PKN52_10695, partial [Trueperaceae bacterium]|nr:hypothetical protein [Trueperaceae bacterium]